MVIEGLGLYYTMRCNAACAHCGVWSAPDRGERMSLEQASRYIHLLAENNKPKVVVFVGGEPLLHLEDICELTRITQSYGIVAQVSTNAFWASTEERALRTMEALAEAGLGHLALSADSYHSEFIDPKNVGRAFAAARQFGLIRKLQVINSAVSEEGDDLIEAIGVDPAEILEHSHFKIRRRDPDFDPSKWIIFNRHSVAPFGRAAFLSGHAIMETLEQLEDFPCFMARKFPIIYPNGDTYACCCTAGFYKEYLVGNLEQQSLKELDAKLEDDVVFEAINKVGPVKLAKAVRSCGVDMSDGFANPCHACRETMARADRKTLVDESRKLLLLEELFGDGRAQEQIQDLV